jgi:hypothetical protein
MWTIIWQALMGNLSGVISALTGVIGKLSDNDAAKLKAAIGADTTVAVTQLQTESRVTEARFNYLGGMWITQWLIAAALIPPIVHSGMIYLDSSPIFWHVVGSWSVPPAPSPYGEREWLMISALLGISTVATTGLGITRMFMRR